MKTYVVGERRSKEDEKKALDACQACLDQLESQRVAAVLRGDGLAVWRCERRADGVREVMAGIGSGHRPEGV